MACGIVSVADLRRTADVVHLAKELAEGVQHRGDVSAGLAVARDGVIDLLKDNGFVRDVLSPDKLAALHGPSAIAHTRYATSGSRDASLAQPWERKGIAFGFNGTIANHDELIEQFLQQGEPLQTTVDTEPIQRLLLEALAHDFRRRLTEVMRMLEHRLDGAFNITSALRDGRMFAYRNGNGNRPLAYAIVDGRLVVTASEDSAIKRIFPLAQTYDLPPGHLLTVEDGALQVERVMDIKHARCFFEWVYFANHESTLDAVSVRSARYGFGQKLAEADTEPMEGAKVVPVPDSAQTAGYGYAHTKNFPLVNDIRNLLPGCRTFIGGREDREEKARRKYGFDVASLAGKDIILVDDSMVRATTLRVLIGRLRSEAHVGRIHLRIACPPILAPCYYGIDFATIQELVARTEWPDILRTGVLPSRVLDALARNLGADSLRFLSVEAVREVLHTHAGGLCMACVTGEYPTPAGQRLYNIAAAEASAKKA